MLDPTSRARSLTRRFDHVLAALAAQEDRRETLTPAAVSLLARVQTAVTDTRAAFDARWQKLQVIPQPARDDLRIRLCEQVLRVLAEVANKLLPALDGTASHGIPVELDPVLTRLTGRADPTSPLIILSSAPGFQYSVQGVADPTQLFTSILGGQQPAGALTQRPFLVLRLPRLERDSALLHVVMVGHEVGHVRDWATQLSQNLAPPPLVLAGAAASAAETAAYKTMIALWAREIVADIFGALIFGPASLLAFSELVLTVGTLAGDSLTHPAPNRRIEIILRVLQSKQFLGLAEVAQLLSPLDAATTGAVIAPTHVADIPNQAISDAAWAWLQAQLQTLITSCEAAVQPDEVLLAADWTDVEEAAAELGRGRPYGERRGATGSDGNPTLHPVADAVILNGGWLLRGRDYVGLAKVVGLTPTDARQSAELGAVLDGLLLKSLEISDWRRSRPWVA